MDLGATGRWWFPRRIGGVRPWPTAAVDKRGKLHILNHMVQYRTRGEAVNLVAAAIADPTRRAILDRLARGPARISDVAQPFSMSLTGFCKHVRVLERAKLCPAQAARTRK